MVHPGWPSDHAAPPRAVDAFTHVVHALGDVVAEVRGVVRAPRTGSAEDPRRLLRLSDAERDAAAEILRDAYAEGRIDLDEFEQRLTIVHAARVHAELPPALADLPGAFGGVPLPPPPDETVSAVLRGVRRSGVWELPPRLRVQARGATVVLDLRAARVRSAVVEIDVRVTAGRVVIIVPDGVSVELRDGLTVLGGRRDDLATRRARTGRTPRTGRTTRTQTGPASPALRLLVGGEVVGGQLVVRPPTVRERWRGV